MWSAVRGGALRDVLLLAPWRRSNQKECERSAKGAQKERKRRAKDRKRKVKGGRSVTERRPRSAERACSGSISLRGALHGASYLPGASSFCAPRSATERTPFAERDGAHSFRGARRSALLSRSATERKRRANGARSVCDSPCSCSTSYSCSYSYSRFLAYSQPRCKFRPPGESHPRWPSRSPSGHGHGRGHGSSSKTLQGPPGTEQPST